MNKKQLINLLRFEGFSDKVLKAFEKVRREEFIPENLREYAYLNEPLPIGKGATISQPYTIAFMLDLLELNGLKNYNGKKGAGNDAERRGRKIFKILEIGSGSGYVLALINEICQKSEIYGVEIIKELIEKSKKVLKGEKNIKIICGNGLEEAGKYGPFDRILISAAADEIPEKALEQLNEGGVMVCPVRNSIFQIKIKGKILKKEFPGFVFVPLVE